MRILRLELRAFGPFSGEQLDLSAGPPALHLVYGSNETGKSTARRALEGLLYGIPERTPDAHLHQTRHLRVGALLQAADGRTLHVVRRKGRKNTLLDADDNVLDEGQLNALLRGVSRERFLATFALGHESLRAGAEDLEQALGDVGESLFDAGLGGRGVHRVLSALQEQCDGLWAPRASTRPLAQALHDYRESLKSQHKAELSGTELSKRRSALEDLRTREAELRNQRAAIRVEEASLRRAVTVLPLLSRRAAKQSERAALGDTPPLPDDAAVRRQQAERALADSGAQVRTLQAERERHKAAHERLDVLDALLQVPDDAIDELERQLGRHRSALADRPKLEQRLARVEDELRALMTRLDSSLPLNEAHELSADELLVSRVHELSERRGALVSRREDAAQRVAELQVQRDALHEKREASRAAADPTGLDEVLSLARALGDVPARRDHLVVTIRTAQHECDVAWQSLSPRGDTPEITMALSVPTVDDLNTFAEAWAQLAQRAERLAERRIAREAAASRVRAELHGEQAAGDVPDAAELGAVRARRDGQWQDIRAGVDPSGPAGEQFEQSLRDADDIADRLRREAASVERKARLQAACKDADAELTDLADDESALAAERVKHKAEWAALWEPSDLPPGEVAARLVWRADWQRLGARLLAASAAREALDAFDARLRDTTTRIIAALAATGEPGPGRVEQELVSAFVTGVQHTEALRERLRSEGEAAARLADDLASAESDLAEAVTRVEAAERAVSTWASEWQAAMQPLGLLPETSGLQAVERLTRLAELDKLIEARSASNERLQGMDRDAQAFAERVASLSSHAPDDEPAAPLEARAHALVALYRRARVDADRRDGLDAELKRNAAELDDALVAVDLAEQQLEALRRLAGVESVAALPEVERRSARANELDERLAELDVQIAEAGDGASAAALEEQHGELSLDAARARLEDLEGQRTDLDENLRELQRELGSAESGLELHDDQRAADLALQSQGHLARVRGLARRWACMRLASVLLEREIERYREEHQGPVLSRASELLPRLTGNRYVGLRAEVDERDRPVLRCLRADGERLDVPALSDGTRDQLFLALRVASLERQAAHDEPFPLVVDDVLVHFDDKRTRLALEVLGELAATTQVILFTHHERVAELARLALPGDVLVEHSLDAKAHGAAD